MLAGIMAIFSAIANVIAKIISFIPWWLWVCIAIFFFGGWVFYGGSCRDFCCHHTPRPRPEKWDQLTVTKAITGASLDCGGGRRGRREKSVNLAHIAAPADEPLAEQSRASLERLAGNFVRVRHQGLLRPALDDKGKPVEATPGIKPEEKEVNCEECDGTGQVSNMCTINCLLCQGDPACPFCHGTGKLKLTYGVIERCQTAIANHMGCDSEEGDDGYRCEECRKENKPCPVLTKILTDILTSNATEPETIECPKCYGAGKYYEQPLEARPVVGVIYSAYGQCLNTEQVRLGMAKLLPDAPKEWKVFENEAKKKGLGVWKIAAKKGK